MTMRLSSHNGKAVAEVTTLPGCGQIAVLHNSNVAPAARGSGIGLEAHTQRLERLRDEFLYDMAVCTVDEANTAQIKIMERAGWERVKTFTSSRTGHTVSLWTRVL
jgi:RimJ/RimL family protein N-acetyltransferase